MPPGGPPSCTMCGALGALSVPARRGGRPALLGAGQLAREGGTSTSWRLKTSGGSPRPCQGLMHQSLDLPQESHRYTTL